MPADPADRFLAGVERTKRYIRDGNVFHVNLNPRPEDSLPATDRGLHFGDGVLETTAVDARAPQLVELGVDDRLSERGAITRD